MTQCLQKGETHSSTDKQSVHHPEQSFYDTKFVADLGSAQDCNEGSVGGGSHSRENVNFFL
jgi:hypothetical protein|tara:strand:+ start:371 stop:553 length:183 start_codon:yes stop_codon:yes gene_type:complete